MQSKGIMSARGGSAFGGKKMLIGVVVIGAAFVLSGCGSKTAAPASQVKNDSAAKQDAEAPAGGVIGSIKDAMGLGTKMKCAYSMGTGADAVKSTVYIEGKKFKSVGTVNGVTMNTFFDGDAMYNWQEGQKTGMKMTMTCVNDLKASLPQDQSAPGVKSPEDYLKDTTDTSCSPTTESVTFSAPSDVTFTDQCEMMKKSLEMMKGAKLPAGVPSGVPANLPNMPGVPAQ